MTRRMLINCTHPEETRVAIVEGETLVDLEIEKTTQNQLKGNIYKTNITRIEPSLQAAFLDIGSNRNGFLQINDINHTYFQDWNPSKNGRHYRPSIQDVLDPGQQLIVQVVKDERDAKGATLTTNLSIPGRYLVLMLGNQRGGVSRKIVEESQRRKLRQAAHSLKVPPGIGTIIRTAGINKSTPELQKDLDALLDIWHEIVEKSSESTSPLLLYKESDLVIRTIRDYLTSDVDEILIDDKETFDRVSAFVDRMLPNYKSRVMFYDNPRPLFSNYHIDGQVDATNHSEVTLPSGGSIVFNQTEAVVAVDVNSGRATGQRDVEETAFDTNKEAAHEIARQLRLRDLGGLVVIDFIDMGDRRHRASVERILKDAVTIDRAKVEVGRISKFGLLEMSRQRLKASLISQSHITCPHCRGKGRVKTAESAALEALRKIETSVFAGGLIAVRVHMSPATALFILNEKRQILSQMENKTGVSILVYADGRLKPDEYELEMDTGGGVVKESYVAKTPEVKPSENRGPANRNNRGGQDRRQGERGRNNNDRNRQSGGRGRNNQNRNRQGGGRGNQGKWQDRRDRGEKRPNNDSINPTPNTAENIIAEPTPVISAPVETKNNDSLE